MSLIAVISIISIGTYVAPEAPAASVFDGTNPGGFGTGFDTTP